MKLNGFEMFALLLCSCLFGISLGVFNSTIFVTDREMALTTALFVAAVAFFYYQHFNKNALLRYLAHHKTEIENKQLDDLQEAHCRRVMAIKHLHRDEIYLLQGSLDTVSANFDRLNSDFSWMSNLYQDQMRMAQEQEDRIHYLEGKFQEAGQRTPVARQPFSAPPSRIQFANPPRRARSAMRSPVTGIPSPLAQVMEAGEPEEEQVRDEVRPS